MALPPSLKAGNFLSLGKFFFQNVLKDDYPHKKFEAETFKATTSNNNSINYKTECIKKNKEGKTQFEIKDELKFGYKLFGQGYMQTRVKRDGEIKYHFDLGKHMLLKKEHTLFGALKTDMRLEKFWIRFGVGHVAPNFQIWKRIERNFKGDLSMSAFGSFTHGPLLFAVSNITNLTNKSLQKLDMVVNFKQKGLDLTLQHLAIPNQTNKLPLGKLLVAAAYQLNKQYSIAAWFKQNLATPKSRLVFGAQSKPCDKLMLKAKADCKGKTTLSSKFSLCSAVQCTVGAQLNLVDLVKQFDANKLIQIPFGYSLDINI